MILEIGQEIPIGPSYGSKCLTEQLLVKIAPPKTGTIRNGLVAYFVTTAYWDNDVKVDTVVYDEKGNIKFPLGKVNLINTKFRGPNNKYKFYNPVKKKFFTIPSEKFLLEYAEVYVKKQHSDWDNLSQIERDSLIDDYYEDIYMFGLSQDLGLPISEDGNYFAPQVGLKTLLYRIEDPRKEGEKYPRVIITKWAANMPSLTGEYELIPPDIATAIYQQIQNKDNNVSFDPSTLDLEDDVI